MTTHHELVNRGQIYSTIFWRHIEDACASAVNIYTYISKVSQLDKVRDNSNKYNCTFDFAKHVSDSSFI